jgi:hypothetical protein
MCNIIAGIMKSLSVSDVTGKSAYFICNQVN